ncbi:MAG TPA: hypothetical protein VFY10_06810 [Dehalococcoidia bacterium]|nr:hypothetical protein [Dehalococcoidia bacterium]
MNIELTDRRDTIGIDYTSVPTALTAEEIKRDIETVVRRLIIVGQIRMHKHQWLWLLHEAGQLCGSGMEVRLPWVPVHEDQTVVGENTIWGVKVEVED